MMIPRQLINKNYGNDDIWTFERPNGKPSHLAARPETTPSTYAWMVEQLENLSGTKLPYCCWQVGKSFRVEQEAPLSDMRLKEFWQMEFQAAYSADSVQDYYTKSLNPVCAMIGAMIALPTRIVKSNGLADYSEKTMDIEVFTGRKWMEVCSVSMRNDFPIRHRYRTEDRKWVEQNIVVLEISIGLDRCVHAWEISINPSLNKREWPLAAFTPSSGFSRE